MTVAVILIIVLGAAYLVWDIVRVVRLDWRAATRFGESLGRAARRMASIEPPARPDRPVEDPAETRARIARVRACGRARRLTRTIDRWATDYPG